jgi:hypothetical protein
MPAIITSRFRIENANNFKEVVADSNNSVYLGIGKSDPWSSSLAVTTDGAAPTPVDTLVEKNDFWQNLNAMKRISTSDVINLCPRHNWAAGESYVAWDDADDLIHTQPYYIITDEFKVYKCIRAGSGPSTEKPTQTTYLPSAEGDGYVWKYMYLLQAVYQKFLTNNYMPVKTVGSNPGSGSVDEGQWNVQQNAAPGKIYRYVVTNGGSGYNPASPPAVTVVGDGTGAVATATVSVGGVVTGITVSTAGSGFEVNAGTGYSVAYVTIAAPVSGTQAVARAVLSPQGGHGSDATSELGGFFVGIGVSLAGTEGGTDFIVNNSFRQLGIVKNPYDFNTTDVATATTLSSLRTLTLSTHTGFAIGDYITGGTSQAKAFVDSYDAATGIIQYHQNDKTGYAAFQALENVTGNTGGSGQIATSGLGDPEVERFTGEVVFVENRSPINRSASQIEDVKIIIEF